MMISPLLIKSKILKNNDFFLLKTLRWLIYPANKCENANIYEQNNLTPSCVEHENSFITSGARSFVTSFK